MKFQQGVGIPVEIWAIVRWTYVKNLHPTPDMTPHARGEGIGKNRTWQPFIFKESQLLLKTKIPMGHAHNVKILHLHYGCRQSFHWQTVCVDFHVKIIFVNIVVFCQRGSEGWHIQLQWCPPLFQISTCKNTNNEKRTTYNSFIFLDADICNWILWSTFL